MSLTQLFILLSSSNSNQSKFLDNLSRYRTKNQQIWSWFWKFSHKKQYLKIGRLRTRLGKNGIFCSVFAHFSIANWATGFIFASLERELNGGSEFVKKYIFFEREYYLHKYFICRWLNYNTTLILSLAKCKRKIIKKRLKILINIIQSFFAECTPTTQKAFLLNLSIVLNIL